MDINFEYDGVKASDRLETFATEKLTNLAEKFDDIIRADVFFKHENTSSDETGMICNIRLSLPGPRLFAEASHNNYISSISESIDDIKRQLQKRKGKLKAR